MQAHSGTYLPVTYASLKDSRGGLLFLYRINFPGGELLDLLGQNPA